MDKSTCEITMKWFKSEPTWVPVFFKGWTKILNGRDYIKDKFELKHCLK